MAVKWFEDYRMRVKGLPDFVVKKLVGKLCGKNRTAKKVDDKVYFQIFGICGKEIEVLVEERNDQARRLTVLSILSNKKATEHVWAELDESERKMILGELYG